MDECKPLPLAWGDAPRHSAAAAAAAASTAITRAPLTHPPWPRSRVWQIMLDTSEDADSFKKEGFTKCLMTWRTKSARHKSLAASYHAVESRNERS